MSGFFNASGGSSQPSQPNNTYGFGGQGTVGEGTTMTAGSANVKGNYSATIITTSAALSGFIVEFGLPSSASAKYKVDIRSGGSTIIVPDLYVAPGSTSSGTFKVFIPLAVGSGVALDARCQSSVGSATLKISIVEVVANAGVPPGFTSMVALNNEATAGTTLAGTGDVPLTDTWTEIVASTAATYGAIMAIVGDNGTAPGTAQSTLVSLGTGAAAAEAAYMKGTFGIFTGLPYLRLQMFLLIQKTIASGTRLSAKANSTTAGTDNLRIGLYGFVV